MVHTRLAIRGVFLLPSAEAEPPARIHLFGFALLVGALKEPERRACGSDACRGAILEAQSVRIKEATTARCGVLVKQPLNELFSGGAPGSRVLIRELDAETSGESVFQEQRPGAFT